MFSQESQYLQAPLINFNPLLLQLHRGICCPGEGEQGGGGGGGEESVLEEGGGGGGVKRETEMMEVRD